MMTLEQLKAYRSEKAEIRELGEKLRAPLGSAEFYGTSVIKDYKTGYPRPQAVSGYDLEAERAARYRWAKKKAILERRCWEVEEYIDSIPDSRTRRVFRFYFEDGRTENQIGRIMHMERSLVSKIIKKGLSDGSAKVLRKEASGGEADAEGRGNASGDVHGGRHAEDRNAGLGEQQEPCAEETESDS